MNPFTPSSPSTDPPEPAAESPKPPWWRRTLKFLAYRLVFWYVVVCLIVMCFQRMLIYHPQPAEKITASESPLPAGFVNDFTYETEEGLTLRGWHLSRTGNASASLKNCRRLVLFFHGNAGDRRGRIDYAQIFSGAGADVLLVDYRGYADNPGSPNETGLAEDARAAWKYATETCGVKPERIVLFGESLGGGVAVRLAQEVCQAGTPPAAIVLRSTFSSLADAARHHYPWLPVRWLLWDRYPSNERIGDVTCPVLILHGTEDNIVPYELGEKLYNAARANPPLVSPSDSSA